MKHPLRKSLAALALAGGSLGAFLYGPALLEDARFARAEEKVTATKEELSHLEGVSSIFRKVGKAVEPTVVNIVVRKAPVQRPEGYDDMLRRFFPDRDGDGQPDLPEGFDPDNFDSMGTGSGVIMEVDGKDAYILTNNHVAGGASSLRVTLADGRVIENGKVLGTDAKTDLAVVKITADRLTPAVWGDSDKLEKGDWILAFGSPFGYIGSMSHGIVSALNRDAGILRQQQGYENFIQVDAPINPGNSGGPLVNVQGEVVGINTAIASRTGSFSGIGFAIPANQAKFVYTALKEKGKVTRGWLGVSISDVSVKPELARSFGYQGDNGVFVQDTFPKTPAFGKLKEGDIITALNGKQVRSVQELRNTVAATAPNTELTMTIFREGKSADVKITLGEQPEDLTLVSGRPGERPEVPAPVAPPATTADAMGMTLETVNEELAGRFNLGDSRDGALVTKVDPNSNAAEEGLRPGDLITQVQGQKVSDAKEAANAMNKAAEGDGVRLRVTNALGSRFVFLKPKK